MKTRVFVVSREIGSEEKKKEKKNVRSAYEIIAIRRARITTRPTRRNSSVDTLFRVCFSHCVLFGCRIRRFAERSWTEGDIISRVSLFSPESETITRETTCPAACPVIAVFSLFARKNIGEKPSGFLGDTRANGTGGDSSARSSPEKFDGDPSRPAAVGENAPFTVSRRDKSRLPENPVGSPRNNSSPPTENNIVFSPAARDLSLRVYRPERTTKRYYIDDIIAPATSGDRRRSCRSINFQNADLGAPLRGGVVTRHGLLLH